MSRRHLRYVGALVTVLLAGAVMARTGFRAESSLRMIELLLEIARWFLFACGPVVP